MRNWHDADFTLYSRSRCARSLHDVSWETYEQLIEELEAEHRHARLTYDEGELEIISPSAPHQRWKKRIARLIELMAFELQIEIECLRQTTFRRKIRRMGLEPDECYYIQNVEKVRRKAAGSELFAPFGLTDCTIAHLSKEHAVHCGFQTVWPDDEAECRCDQL